MDDKIQEEKYKKLENYLKPQKKDIVYDGIKASLSAIPGFGGVLAEIFSFGVESPIQKRKRDFLIELAKNLDKLEEEKQIKISELRDNPEFIDLIMLSLEIAMKNSRREKIQMLQTGVINSILSIKEDMDLNFTFLKAIDDLTWMHVKTLNEIGNKGYLGVYDFQLDLKFNKFLSELFAIGLIEYVPKDEENRIIHQKNNMEEIIEFLTEKQSMRITEKGKKFQEFIFNHNE